MAKRLGELLVEAGLVSAQAIEKALQHQKVVGHRLGDCLVELNLVSEPALLRLLAGTLGTRYVTADKMAKARIAPEVLDLVPVRMAEAHHVLPLTADFERKALSVVMAEPQDTALLKELAEVTGLSEVVAYVGSRAAIATAIRKHYYSDAAAFSPAPVAAVERPLSSPQPLKREGPTGTATVEAVAVPGRGETGSSVGRAQPTMLREALGTVRGSVAENDFAETLNILVGLIEMPRKEFRAHSAQVARQAVGIARRLGMSPREVSQVSIAAYLHDVGKRPDLHFTLPALSLSVELRTEARRYIRAPIKLFETVHLPPPVNAILAQLYEAFDGSGIPSGSAGEDVPLGARIIASVDALFDYTRNPHNHLNRVLTKAEALTVLGEQKGRLFDPRVVEALAHLQGGDLLRQRVETDGRTVVVADLDDDARADLGLALSKAGLVSQQVARLDGVVDAVLAGEASTITVGLSYGVQDLLALTGYVRGRAESAAIPIVVVGQPSDAAMTERLMLAGVTGFVPTPLVPDEAAALVKRALDGWVAHNGPGRVVRGSYDELPASELVAILGRLRKSGRLLVRNGPQEGAVLVERGHAVHASWGGKQADAALLELLQVKQAEFCWDPDAVLLDAPQLDHDLEAMGRALVSTQTGIS